MNGDGEINRKERREHKDLNWKFSREKAQKAQKQTTEFLPQITQMSADKNQKEKEHMKTNQMEPMVETYVDTGWRFVVLAALGAALLGAVLVLLGGCATGAGTPPKAWETKFYTITTNEVPVVHTFTNYVTNVVVKTQTREVPVIVQVTNTQGVTVTATNTVTVVSNSTVYTYETNRVTLTNSVPDYAYTPNATAAEVKEGAGIIGNMFGAGGLATTIAGALFGVYGSLRSSRKGKVAAVAVQSVEMAREILKTTPQGKSLDAGLTAAMNKHQLEMGVVQEIGNLLVKHVDESNDFDAKEIADDVLAFVNERMHPATSVAAQPTFAPALPKV